MIALEVHYNGKKVSVAGADREGMTSADLVTDAQCSDENGNVGYFTLRGVYDANEEQFESMKWLKLDNLHVGDEFRIRICDAESVDPPLSIESSEYSCQRVRRASHWLRRAFWWFMLLPLSLALANVVLVPLNLVFGPDMGNVYFFFAGLLSWGVIVVVGAVIEFNRFIHSRRAKQEATEQKDSGRP